MDSKLLDSVFQTFMRSEKQIVYDYWTNAPYEVFFRENKVANQHVDYSSIYYSCQTPIHEGMLLFACGQVYLCLNQQAVENPIYRMSDLARCNATIDIFSNGRELVIPAFAGTLLSPYGSYSGNMISTMSGNIEFLSQLNEQTENIKVGSKFSTMGNSYSVRNLLLDQGVLHIFSQTEQGAPAPTYSLELNLDSEYEKDTTATLTAIPKRIQDGRTDIVQNAVIIWESSNTDIVTIDETGLASFIGAGECEIVAIWREHNLATTGIIKVVAENVKIATITPANGQAVIKQGGRANFNAAFYDDEIADTSIVPVWSFEYPDTRLTGKIEKLANSSGQMIALRAADNATIGAVFNLCVTDASGEYNGLLPIEIAPFM